MEDLTSKELIFELFRRVYSNPRVRKTALFSILGAVIGHSILRWKLNSKLKSKAVKGKLIVLTGGATGLGRAQAFALAERGARLVLWDINEEELMKTVADVKSAYPNAQVDGYKINLADRDSVYALARRVQEEKGFVWGLWNNAGIIAGQNLVEESDKKIELTMSVNIMAHFWTTKAFLPAMLERNEGHIVGVASAAAFFGSARMVSYCASKHAAKGFLEALRIELGALGKTGVGVTGVYPAHINTDLFKGYKMTKVMEPDWVASQIISCVETNTAVCLLPRATLSMAVMWQGILPTWLWDVFMIPTNQSLSKWSPAQAERIFDKMS